MLFNRNSLLNVKTNETVKMFGRPKGNTSNRLLSGTVLAGNSGGGKTNITKFTNAFNVFEIKTNRKFMKEKCCELLLCFVFQTLNHIRFMCNVW